MLRSCSNLKVVGAIVAVGMALLSVPPQLLLVAAPVLLLAACPLSMLLMRRMDMTKPSTATPTNAFVCPLHSQSWSNKPGRCKVCS